MIHGELNNHKKGKKRQNSVLNLCKFKKRFYMKFTKEDARKELMGKIPQKGQTLNLSERSINEMLDTLMPLLANDETEISDFVEQVLPTFRTADGNVKNDVSVGINEYKKNNPVNPTTPPVEPKPKEKVEDNPNDALLKRLEALESELAESKKNKTIKGLREQLVSEMKNKGVKDDEWIDSFVSEINITEDFDVNAKAEHYVGVYNKMNARVNPNVTPKGTGGGNADEKRISDVIAAAAELAKKE